MAPQLLTAAGANYYMDVALNTDRMLAYFDTAHHDDATLREIHNRRPAPEFERWCVKMGLLENGAAICEKAGDPTIFLCNGSMGGKS